MTELEIKHLTIEVMELLNASLNQHEFLKSIFEAILQNSTYKIPQEYKMPRED